LYRRRSFRLLGATSGPLSILFAFRKEDEAMAIQRLYERLGGVYSIATVVDDFIDRIMIDPILDYVSSDRSGLQEEG